MIETLKLNKNAGARGKRAAPASDPGNPLFEWEPPRARHSDPETSHEAAASITESHARQLYDTIVMLLRQAGPDGLTTHDLTRLSGIPRVSISPSMVRLEEQGRLLRTNIKRIPIGWTRKSLVWIAPEFFTEKTAATSQSKTRLSDYRRAIEFGGYLATSAEQFMQAVNTELYKDDPDAWADHWKSLASAIYEFRKRVPK